MQNQLSWSPVRRHSPELFYFYYQQLNTVNIPLHLFKYRLSISIQNIINLEHIINLMLQKICNDNIRFGASGQCKSGTSQQILRFIERQLQGYGKSQHCFLIRRIIVYLCGFLKSVAGQHEPSCKLQNPSYHAHQSYAAISVKKSLPADSSNHQYSDSSA